MRQQYDIPGFSRYVVRLPFEIIDTKRNAVVFEHSVSDRSGYPYVKIYDDDGKRRHRSVVVIAALAFRGQCPDGYLPIATDAELMPSTVLYVTKDVAYRKHAEFRKRLNRRQRETVYKKYMSGEFTQDELAEKYGVSQTAIWKIVNRVTY